MTELLYHTDSYIQDFDSIVNSVLPEERAVILDRTAFYPGGGGQPCDFGSLSIAGGLYPVVKVKKLGEDVLHFLGGADTLPTPGSACPRDPGLGAAIQPDAHPHRAACPVRNGIPQLRCARYRRGYGTAQGPDGF